MDWRRTLSKVQHLDNGEEEEEDQERHPWLDVTLESVLHGATDVNERRRPVYDVVSQPSDRGRLKTTRRVAIQWKPKLQELSYC